MINLRIVVALALTAVVAATAGCARKSRGDRVAADPRADASNDPEITIKTRWLGEGLDGAAWPLKTNRRIACLNAKGECIYPVSLSVNDDGTVFISDNNAHAVRVYRPEAPGIATLPIEGGQLVWPNTIQATRSALFVADDDGIKIFRLDGTFQRKLRVFYGINHFAVGEEGSIYLNPGFAVEKVSNPLVVRLSATGQREQEFGRRLNHPNVADLDDMAYLCPGPAAVAAVFKHRPVAQLYSPRGQLLTEIRINHPAFDSLNTLAADEKFVRPRPGTFRLPYFVAGARLIADRLVVLLHLPRPEIVVYNLKGEEIGRYRGSGTSLFTYYRGFDVQLTRDGYSFWILAGDDDQIALWEFTAAKDLG